MSFNSAINYCIFANTILFILFIIVSISIIINLFTRDDITYRISSLITVSIIFLSLLAAYSLTFIYLSKVKNEKSPYPDRSKYINILYKISFAISALIYICMIVSSLYLMEGMANKIWFIIINLILLLQGITILIYLYYYGKQNKKVNSSTDNKTTNKTEDTDTTSNYEPKLPFIN